MSFSSIVKGVSVGIAAGAATYAIANASGKSKRKVKSGTGRAIKAVGDVIEGLGFMMS
ncbi:MAG: hypothetical protein QM689_03970 [Oscillospiraceae bacterium]